MEFELFVSDWTNNVPPPTDAFVVVEGVESWTPDLEFGGDVHSFGEFKIVNRAPLLVYPDGHSGAEIEVTFVMTDEMISGSAMSVTNVEIYDSTILVWGQTIPVRGRVRQVRRIPRKLGVPTSAVMCGICACMQR